MPRPTSPWTDELVQKLRELAPTKTASVIRQIFLTEFAVDFTRNAISGKLVRLGIYQKQDASPPKELKPRSDLGMGRVEMPKRKPRPSHSIAPLPFVPRVVETIPLHLTLIDLTDDTCKWECSGADHPSDFTFCGHDVKAGYPYCLKHCAIAYQKPTGPVRRAFIPKRDAA